MALAVISAFRLFITLISLLTATFSRLSFYFVFLPACWSLFALSARRTSSVFFPLLIQHRVAEGEKLKLRHFSRYG